MQSTTEQRTTSETDSHQKQLFDILRNSGTFSAAEKCSVTLVDVHNLEKDDEYQIRVDIQSTYSRHCVEVSLMYGSVTSLSVPDIRSETSKLFHSFKFFRPDPNVPDAEGYLKVSQGGDLSSDRETNINDAVSLFMDFGQWTNKLMNSEIVYDDVLEFVLEVSSKVSTKFKERY